MMSEERDRDYTGSKGDTSLGGSSRRGSGAMYKNVIPCDKIRAKPGEFYGGILAGVIGLRKTLQVICRIFSSLDAAVPFVVPAESERLSKKRRVKTTLVIAPHSAPWRLGGDDQGANQSACQVWCTPRLHVSWTEARANNREAGSIPCHSHDYQIAGGDLS